MENYSNNSVILNKSLIKKYPWLIPRSRRTGKVVDNYDYTWTELDAMPKGWREAFGELLCEEIQEELEKFNFVEKYMIIQIKEKNAELRWYDNGYPSGSKLHDIISNYSALSSYICIRCGELDVPCVSNGWIVPMCKNCLKKTSIKNPENYWEQISKEQFPYTLPLTRTYKQWSFIKDEPEIITVDLTPTVQKIRKRYAERHGK